MPKLETKETALILDPRRKKCEVLCPEGFGPENVLQMTLRSPDGAH